MKSMKQVLAMILAVSVLVFGAVPAMAKAVLEGKVDKISDVLEDRSRRITVEGIEFRSAITTKYKGDYDKISDVRRGDQVRIEFIQHNGFYLITEIRDR